MLEDKKIMFFLLAIVAVLTFTFTLANHVNELGQTKAPWLHRTDKDVILDLRMKINNIQLALSYMSIENRELRKLVFTTKPDHWTTWVELLDECKRLNKKIEKLQEKIEDLEVQLGIRQWESIIPFQEM